MKRQRLVYKIKFTFFNHIREPQQHEIKFTKTLEVERIDFSVPGDLTGDLKRPESAIQFSKGKPEKLIFFEKNPVRSRARGYEISWLLRVIPKEKWLDSKIYFWSEGSELQHDEIRRGQETLRVLEFQQAALQKCCQNSECLNYFARIQPKFKNPNAKNGPAQSEKTTL